MRLIETLTSTQINELITGSVVGIFVDMFRENDVFYDELHNICLGYYLEHSGNKTTSPMFNMLRTTSNADNVISQYIRGKFLEKWKRVYEALISEVYNPLYNSEYREHKTGSNSSVDIYDSRKTKTGINTDTTTFDTNVTNDGNASTEETTSRNLNDSNDVYGFNSSTPVGDTTSTEVESETVSSDFDKNRSHNVETKTGTEEKQFGINESDSHTGTDTTNDTIDETITKSGRDGSAANLIEAELRLRDRHIFYDIVYKDIDSVLTIPIYI